MEQSIVNHIKNYFKDVTLNSTGAVGRLYSLLRDGDVGRAVEMMKSRETDIDNAIREYNPQLHAIMRRKNKWRKGGDSYITEKLPRGRQRYINEVELFFLLAKPIKWMKREGDDDAFEIYVEYLEKMRFDAKMRKAKRLAGSELESALVYHVYQEDGEFKADLFVASRSQGYRIRTLFDQYGNMMSFALGYQLNEADGRAHQHWDIYTKDWVFQCAAQAAGWRVETHPNPLGKIPVAYFHQPKAWDGAEPRMEREERADSKLGDTNNYFSDPIAKASADVVDSMADPDKPGKLIQLSGSQSRFEYVQPPTDSASRLSEKKDLNDSILFDTFTPDLSFDNLKGMGTLTGAAIKNSMVLGYMKRDNRMEVYHDAVDRFRSVTLELMKLMHPDKAAAFERIEITFRFQDPFDDENQSQWPAIASLYSAGLMSLETGVQRLALTDRPDEEADRIRMAAMELQTAQAQAEAEAAGNTDNSSENTENERNT